MLKVTSGSSDIPKVCSENILPHVIHIFYSTMKTDSESFQAGIGYLFSVNRV